MGERTRTDIDVWRRACGACMRCMRVSGIFYPTCEFAENLAWRWIVGRKGRRVLNTDKVELALPKAYGDSSPSCTRPFFPCPLASPAGRGRRGKKSTHEASQTWQPSEKKEEGGGAFQKGRKMSITHRNGLAHSPTSPCLHLPPPPFSFSLGPKTHSHTERKRGRVERPLSPPPLPSHLAYLSPTISHLKTCRRRRTEGGRAQGRGGGASHS